MYMLWLYTVALASDPILSLPIRALGLVEIRTRLAAKSSILVSNAVDAADFIKLRAGGCHSVEDVEGIIPLLELEKARVEAAKV